MQRDVVEIRTNVDRVASQLRRAGRDFAGAGGASVALARDVAGEATAASNAAETGERAAIIAGRAALGVTVTALNLPELVREGARRGIEMAENVGTQLAESMLTAGSRALSAAADYVNEIVPRRRVRRQALEQLLLEQIAWAQAGTDALERSAGDVDDDALRVELVRCKLQTIRHTETLTQILARVGGRLRPPEKMPHVQPVRVDGNDHARVPHDLASALSCAEQEADGWRVLAEIAATAEPEEVGAAIGSACESVGSEPDEQVDLLRQAAMRRTVDAVLA